MSVSNIIYPNGGKEILNCNGIYVAGVPIDSNTSGNVRITGNLSVTGNETVGGTLGVTSNATVGGTLGVTGTSTLHALVPNATNTYDLGASANTWRNSYANNSFSGTNTYYLQAGPQGVNSTPSLYWTNSVAADPALYMRKPDNTNDRIVDVYQVRPTLVGAQNSTTIGAVTDNTISWGSSGNRWKDIWAGNAVIQTSDANQKYEIEHSDLGIDFVNQLIPRKYKYIDGTSGRTHYGLIAQEVYDVLNANEIPTQNFAGYIKDEGDFTYSVGRDENGNDIMETSHQINYGLRYEEIISPMVKAIQELSARVVLLESKLTIKK